MPLPELVPLAEQMDARIDELIERLLERLPAARPYYASLPPDILRAAATNLYKVIRDSVEEGGVERYGQAITQIGRTRLAQGGTVDDLRAATDIVRQINISLVDNLVRNSPEAAIPAFNWLDLMASKAFKIFTTFAEEDLARQAQELEITVTLSERLEQAQGLREVSEALFENLPGLGVDRAIILVRTLDDLTKHEVVAAFDRDPQAPLPPIGTRIAPGVLLRDTGPDTLYVDLPVADLDLPEGLRDQLAPPGNPTLVAFPFWHGQEARAVVLLGYHQPHQLTPEEQRFFGLLARLLRNRISSIRLTQRLQQQIERTAMLQALVESASDAIIITDTDLKITYVNVAAAQVFGFERPGDMLGRLIPSLLSDEDQVLLRDQIGPQLTAKQPWRGSTIMVTQQGERIPMSSAVMPLLGEDGELYGFGGINHDERERLALIGSLRESNGELQHTLDLLRQISTPLVPVMEGILVMPIVGELDGLRAAQMLETLLEGITRAGADTIILDITGVPVVDTSVANGLVQAARAARLLGADSVLVGITPEVAQALVGLGVDLREVVTRGDLSSGIAYALRRRGYRIVRDGTALASDALK